MICGSPMRNAMHIQTRKSLLLLSPLLFLPALACRAVTELLLPPNSISGATPPALVTASPSVEAEGICTNLTEDILEVARYEPASGEGLGSAKSPEGDATYLVTYVVLAGRIGAPNMETVPDQYLDEQQDRSAHQAVWDYFTTLIPSGERRMVDAFVVMTDGPDNILGAISQIGRADHWALEVDVEDARDPYDLTYTLLHEFGHLLTLNSDQLELSRAVFDHPDDQELFDREAAKCPQYFPGEGCSRPNSYINKFYERFWTGLHDEWLEIDAEEDQNAYEDRLDAFYRKYRDQFVSDYAATSPAEDIAETWTYFVLDSTPAGSSTAEAKLLFFYEYPELISLRTKILGNLCESFPQ